MSRGFRLDPPSPSWFDVVFCLTPPPPEGPRGLCTAPGALNIRPITADPFFLTLGGEITGKRNRIHTVGVSARAHTYSPHRDLTINMNIRVESFRHVITVETLVVYKDILKITKKKLYK